MRQAGIIAAGALYALEHHIERLAEDHANAQLIADAVRQVEGLELLGGTVDTNIVIFRVDPALGTAAEFCGRLKDRGLQMLAIGAQQVRAVTHLDLDRPASQRRRRNHRRSRPQQADRQSQERVGVDVCVTLHRAELIPMTEWQAGDYSQVSGLQQAMAEEALGKLTLKGSERILDVGCGDGKITAEIAVRIPAGSVLGVDPSRDMIAFAASHFPAAQKPGDCPGFAESSEQNGTVPLAAGAMSHPNLRFEVADARRLPYRDEFDLVVSFNALHWVVDQAAALNSIRAALKPTGQALLRFVPQGQCKCLEDVIDETRQSGRWSGHFAGFQKPYAHFTADAYRALAEQSGFRVVRLNVEAGSWDFRTRAAFTAFARATFVEWTQHLPESDRERFITDVLDQYQAVAADGPTELNTFKFYQMEVALEASGEK